MSASDIQDEVTAFGARDANEHLLAALALRGGEKHVTVVRLALEDARHARAAHALLARRGHVDTALAQDLQDARVGRNVEGSTGARERHFERFTRPRLRKRIRCEVLAVNG